MNDKIKNIFLAYESDVIILILMVIIMMIVMMMVMWFIVIVFVRDVDDIYTSYNVIILQKDL